MRYSVRRTSSRYDDEDKPCDEAVKRIVTETQCFTVPNPYDFRKHHVLYGEKWFEEGSNHRSDGKFIFRDFHVERWCVEINTLDELTAFVKKYGEIVLDNGSIEIYDDYRD